MGHSMNTGGIATNMRGVCIDAFRVTFGAAGAPTLVDNGKTGLLSVVHTSEGLYTFTITSPINPKLVAVFPVLSAVNGAGAMWEARYVEGSYNATTGVFQIVVSEDEDSVSVVDPTQNTALDVLLITQRYNTL